MPDSNCMVEKAGKVESKLEATLTVMGNVEGLSVVVLATTSRK